jgi:Tol biopolymer transport system component
VTGDRAGYAHFTPTFAPGGRHLFYARCLPDPPGGCAIYSVRTRGGGRRALTAYDQGDRADFYPDVSPDGRRIAFTRFGHRGIQAQVWVVRADGSHAHPITTPRLEAGAPQWTRDGRHLLVTSHFSHVGTNVYRIRDDGSEVTRLTCARFPHNAQFPAPSPSGSRIVFSDDRAYPQVIGADLFVMGPDGSGQHAVTSNGRLLDPDWGTAPLVPAGTAPPVTPSVRPTTPHRTQPLPRWLADRVAPSTSGLGSR